MSELIPQVHAEEMEPGLHAVVDGVDDADGYISQHRRPIHNHRRRAPRKRLEVRQQPNGEMHGSSDVDVEFLVCFSEIPPAFSPVIDVQ